MLNNYFKPTANRPTSYAPYFSSKYISENSEKVKNQNKYRRYKLFIMLIARATHRQVRDSWQQMWAPDRKAVECINIITNLSEKNCIFSVYLAFDHIKRAAVLNRAGQKLLKGMMTLLSRMQKYKLKQSFCKLILNTVRFSSNVVNNIIGRRDYEFTRKIQTLFKRHKKEVLVQIVAYAKFVKSYSKVRVIAVIQNRYQRHLKQMVFSKLTRLILVSTSKTNIDKQVRELKTQLSDMTVQLENKNQNIQRLEDELNIIKIQQSNISFNQNVSYGQKSKKGSFKSYSLKRVAQNENQNRSHNQSGDNISINDLSIGSLLGNLNKSRYGSSSKMQQSGDCNCGYKTKYVKYKSINESLKNQIEIVKEELEVAKDLNEHFTNEIKQYLTGQVSDGDYDKLKKQYKILLEERDQLREKAFKYQKHISSLKAEFKLKMEELYRKVRKDM